jgi:methylenetetrahydrofolate reductase (NADPH)
MFFDNNYYFNFLEKAREAGINCRIIPGIIPITNYKQIKKFADMTAANIPQDIVERMEPYQDDPNKIYEIGVEIAIKQCRELLDRGAPGLHFYTLNKSRAAVEIYESLSNSFIDIKKRYESSFSPHIDPNK